MSVTGGKGGSKSKSESSGTQDLDPQSQGYVNRMRDFGYQGSQMALNRAGSFFSGPLTPDQIGEAMNPYISNVVDATRGEFDHLRGLASRDVAQGATMDGAFGGSRAAVTEGARLGALDRSQANTIAGLWQTGYDKALSFADHQRQLRDQQLQEPLWRYQQGQPLLNMGLGPTGWRTSGRTSGSGSNWNVSGGYSAPGAGG